MNKKAQDPLTIGGGILVLIFLIWFVPQLFQTIEDVSCENEKKKITVLNSQISQCQTDLTNERIKNQDLQNQITQCQSNLELEQNKLKNCTEYNQKLQEDYYKIQQPVNKYYLIKIESNKTIFFDFIIIYHIQMILLVFSFGITITLKLFEINIEVLKEKHQKEIVKLIREFLIKHHMIILGLIIFSILITSLFPLNI
jgi:hypothetical protein